jgi:hypothetical protein
MVKNSRARASVVPDCGNRRALAYPRDLTGLLGPARVVAIRKPIAIPNDAGFPSLTEGCSIGILRSGVAAPVLQNTSGVRPVRVAGTLQYGVPHVTLPSHIMYLV